MDKDPAGQNADPRPTDPLQAEDKPFGFLRRAGVISGMGLAVLGAAPNLVGTVGGEAGNAVAEAGVNPGKEQRAGAKQNVVVTAPSLKQVAGEYPELSKVRKSIRSYNALPKNKEKRIVFGGALDPSQVKIIGAPAKEGYVSTGHVDRYAVLWQRKIDRETNKTVSIYRALSAGKTRMRLKKGERLFVVRTQEKIANEPAQLPENPPVISVQPIPETNVPVEAPTTPPADNSPAPENPDNGLTNEQLINREKIKFLEKNTLVMPGLNATASKVGPNGASIAAHVFYVPRSQIPGEHARVEKWLTPNGERIMHIADPSMQEGVNRQRLTKFGKPMSVLLPADSTLDTAFISTEGSDSVYNVARQYYSELSLGQSSLTQNDEIAASGWPLDIDRGSGTENMQLWDDGKVLGTMTFSMGVAPNAQNLETLAVLFGNSQEGLPAGVWASGMSLHAFRVVNRPNGQREVETQRLGTYSAKYDINPATISYFAQRFNVAVSDFEGAKTLSCFSRAVPADISTAFVKYRVIEGIDEIPDGSVQLTESN